MSTTAIRAADHLFIGGEWVAPLDGGIVDVVNPATEEPIAQAALGGPMDIDRAAHAAHEAFPDWAARDVAERASVLRRAGGRRAGVRGRGANLTDARAEGSPRLLTLEVGSPQRVAAAQTAACRLFL